MHEFNNVVQGGKKEHNERKKGLILVLLLACCVILGKLLNLSEFLFSIPETGIISPITLHWLEIKRRRKGGILLSNNCYMLFLLLSFRL